MRLAQQQQSGTGCVVFYKYIFAELFALVVLAVKSGGRLQLANIIWKRSFAYSSFRVLSGHLFRSLHECTLVDFHSTRFHLGFRESFVGCTSGMGCLGRGTTPTYLDSRLDRDSLPFWGSGRRSNKWYQCTHVNRWPPVGFPQQFVPFRMVTCGEIHCNTAPLHQSCPQLNH